MSDSKSKRKKLKKKEESPYADLVGVAFVVEFTVLFLGLCVTFLLGNAAIAAMTAMLQGPLGIALLSCFAFPFVAIAAAKLYDVVSSEDVKEERKSIYGSHQRDPAEQNDKPFIQFMKFMMPWLLGSIAMTVLTVVLHGPVHIVLLCCDLFPFATIAVAKICDAVKYFTDKSSGNIDEQSKKKQHGNFIRFGIFNAVVAAGLFSVGVGWFYLTSLSSSAAATFMSAVITAVPFGVIFIACGVISLAIVSGLSIHDDKTSCCDDKISCDNDKNFHGDSMDASSVSHRVIRHEALTSDESPAESPSNFFNFSWIFPSLFSSPSPPPSPPPSSPRAESDAVSLGPTS